MRLLPRIALQKPIKREYQLSHQFIAEVELYRLMLQQTFRNRPVDLIVNFMYKVYVEPVSSTLVYLLIWLLLLIVKNVEMYSLTSLTSWFSDISFKLNWNERYTLIVIYALKGSIFLSCLNITVQMWNRQTFFKVCLFTVELIVESN